MQPVSVAIADVDHDRRTRYEYALRGKPDVELLANIASSVDVAFTTRRAKLRTNITVVEDELARVKRLMPRVLLMDIKLCPKENCIMLELLRRECPATLIVLVGDESGNEELIMDALEAGARGYLSHETAHQQFPKVASVVSRGEAWVPRKILGKIMDRVQHRE